MTALDASALETAILELESELEARKSPRPYAPLAEAYRLQNRLDDSIETARAGLVSYPGHISIRVVLGRALDNSGRLEEATEIYREVTRLDPDNAEARLFLEKALAGSLIDRVEKEALEETPSVAQESIYNYYAFYGYFTWFITGEHRNFSQKKGCFDRVSPKKNLGKGGAGAWELAIRLSHIDLNDKDLNGGAMTDFTFGLNWYLNPATRFSFNYIYSDVIDVGYANIAMVRFQVAF